MIIYYLKRSDSMFIDTHCHIFDEYYDDIDKVINDSFENNINYFINAGVDTLSNKEVLQKVEKYNTMYGVIGIHPEYADNYSNEDLLFIEKNISNKKIVGIGEIGLDYHYEGYNKEKQIKLFESQLILAEKYNIPVVIHSREATLDTMNTLKKYKVTGVIHSFSGSLEIAREYIKMGFKLGVNGVVTFKNSHLKEVIKEIGINNIVFETDSPYLTPEPLRGHQNYPGNIKHIVSFLSEYLNISEKDLSDISNKNVYEVFKITIN